MEFAVSKVWNVRIAELSDICEWPDNADLSVDFCDDSAFAQRARSGVGELGQPNLKHLFRLAF
jgi:hypothetical protein